MIFVLLDYFFFFAVGSALASWALAGKELAGLDVLAFSSVLAPVPLASRVSRSDGDGVRPGSRGLAGELRVPEVDSSRGHSGDGPGLDGVNVDDDLVSGDGSSGVLVGAAESSRSSDDRDVEVGLVVVSVDGDVVGTARVFPVGDIGGGESIIGGGLDDGGDLWSEGRRLSDLVDLSSGGLGGGWVDRVDSSEWWGFVPFDAGSGQDEVDSDLSGLGGVVGTGSQTSILGGGIGDGVDGRPVGDDSNAGVKTLVHDFWAITTPFGLAHTSGNPGDVGLESSGVTDSEESGGWIGVFHDSTSGIWWVFTSEGTVSGGDDTSLDTSNFGGHRSRDIHDDSEVTNLPQSCDGKVVLGIR